MQPQWLFIAPARAVPKLLDKIDWSMDDVDLIEINEAFAAQVIADARGMEQAGHWDWNKVNVNGGAVALGHPIGCSGARVLTHADLCAARSRPEARPGHVVPGRR